MTIVDISSYIAKVASYKPQYVLLDLQTAEIPRAYAELEQQGIPASHIAASDVDYTDTILAHAPAMKGGIDLSNFEPWTDTSDPDVAAYVKALTAAGIDYKNPNLEWGYSLMLWLYTAAKNIGFSTFNSATLTNYLRTATNVPIPLSHLWLNPGPKNSPAVKQPDDLLLQWTGTTFKPLPVGPNKDGWIRGL